MTTLVVDTSVLVGWFHDPADADARILRDAHMAGVVNAQVLDLGMYELGNLLVQDLRWPAPKVADQLDDLLAICGPALVLTPGWLRDAATIAGLHQLSFYDAAWVAAAENLGAALVSTNPNLLDVRLAESPRDVVRRLGLR